MTQNHCYVELQDAYPKIYRDFIYWVENQKEKRGSYVDFNVDKINLIN
jgi:hypothetical protein